jgi:hypothetical protein
MAFQVPASKKSHKQNRFEFEHDGKTFSIPLLKYIPAAAAELLEEGKLISALIVACDDAAAQSAVRLMDADQIDVLTDAWKDASDISPGE